MQTLVYEFVEIVIVSAIPVLNNAELKSVEKILERNSEEEVKKRRRDIPGHGQRKQNNSIF